MLDAYTRRARIYPALISFFPIVVFVIVAIPSLPDWWQRITSLVVMSGLWSLVAQIMRDKGSKAQRVLWASWGGSPTVSALCWRRGGNTFLKQRQHEAIGFLTGIHMPTEAEENADEPKSHQQYEAAISVLRELTRGKEFHLVHEENMDYGFRRNLFAFKAYGVAIALASTAGASVLFPFAWDPDQPSRSLFVAGAGVIGVVWGLSFWRLRSDWVKKPADRYAQQLINAAVALEVKFKQESSSNLEIRFR